MVMSIQLTSNTKSCICTHLPRGHVLPERAVELHHEGPCGDQHIAAVDPHSTNPYSMPFYGECTATP